MYTFLLVKERKKEIQIDSQAAYHPPSKRKKDKFCRVVCREQNAENTWMLESKQAHGMPSIFFFCTWMP
jgi:hypothetical protein